MPHLNPTAILDQINKQNSEVKIISRYLLVSIRTSTSSVLFLRGNSLKSYGNALVFHRWTGAYSAALAGALSQLRPLGFIYCIVEQRTNQRSWSMTFAPKGGIQGHAAMQMWNHSSLGLLSASSHFFWEFSKPHWSEQLFGCSLHTWP